MRRDRCASEVLNRIEIRPRQLDQMTITVRQFTAAEWRTYRDLRLRALRDDPDAFGSTYEREAARPAEDWKDRLAAGVTDAGQLPIVALVGETPVGLAWGRVDERDAT